MSAFLKSIQRSIRSRRRRNSHLSRLLASAERLEDRTLLSATMLSSTIIDEIAPGVVIQRSYDDLGFAAGSNPSAGTPSNLGAQGLGFAFETAEGMPQQAIDGFAEAGQLWSSFLTDDVRIAAHVDFRELAPHVLGQAGSMRMEFPFADVRSALWQDYTSPDDAIAVDSLSSSGNLRVLINHTTDNPNGIGSNVAYVDTTGDNVNTLRVTTANAKALGLLPSDREEADVHIRFNSLFSWDFDRSDGIASGAFDFVGVALHEIGHALGFTSGVDILDFNAASSDGPFHSDVFTSISTLDLFRHSTESVDMGADLDWTANSRSKFFSIDGGSTPIAPLSTGRIFGDGEQASHWEFGLDIGMMEPSLGSGYLAEITETDLRAFDVIGWDLNTANSDLSAVGDAFITPQNQPLVFSSADLLDNDLNASGSELTSHTAASVGTLVFNSSTETFTFTPPSGFEGPVNFDYTGSVIRDVDPNPTQRRLDPSPEVFVPSSRAGAGYSIAISGNRVVVGAPFDAPNGMGGAGMAYVFVRSGEGWIQEAQLFASDRWVADFFGTSVDIDGDTIVVGANGHDAGPATNVGAVYVFTRDGSTWSETTKLQPTGDIKPHSEFGNAVSLDGNTLVVGAWGFDEVELNRGAAFVFTRSGTSWSSPYKLTASDADGHDLFGVSVSISGDQIAIGAYRDDDNGSDSGSTYVYTWDGSASTSEVKLTTSDGTDGDWFGRSVAIDSGTLVVGASRASVDKGAAYVFEQQGTQWLELTKLLPSDGSTGDRFGNSVAISGTDIVVGAYRHNRGTQGWGVESGAAYHFRQATSTTWNQRAKLVALDAELHDWFGSAVAVDNGTIAVGETGNPSAPLANPGAGYILETTELQTDSATVTIDVVDVVAETPTLTVVDAQGNEDSDIPLAVNAALVDVDGSEVLAIEIDGIPPGATLSDGVNIFVGAVGSSWVDISTWNLPQLGITPPENNHTDFTLGVVATSTETFSGNTAQTQEFILVEVLSVNDLPSLSVAADTLIVVEGSQAINSGTFNDIDDVVTLTASLGSISPESGSAGNWTWSFDTLDGPAQSQTVTITADDGHGTLVRETFSLAVENVAPVASIAGPPEAVPNQELSFTLNATDSSPQDETSTMTFDVDWDGDGNFDEQFKPSDDVDPLEAGVQVTHVFTTTGTYLVRVTATDKDRGLSDVADIPVEINSAAIQDGTIVIGTSDGASDVLITAGSIVVTFFDDLGNVVSEQVFDNQNGPTHIVIYGSEQDDRIRIAQDVTDTVQVFAGGGNDIVEAGGGNTIIDGGEGDDTLQGGSGENTLIGSSGNDTLIGGTGINILDGGEGDDVLQDTGGVNVVIGGAGNNTFIPGSGSNSFEAAEDQLLATVFSDSFQVSEGSLLSVPVSEGVLANDVAPDVNPLDAVLVTGPAHGALVLTPDGSFDYTPQLDFNGQDSFTYLARNQAGDSSPTSVTIAVVNVAPAIADATVEVVENLPAGTLVTTLAAADPGNDPIAYSIVGGTGTGVFQLAGDSGEIRVLDTSALDYESIRSFTLVILVTDDDAASNTAEITINLVNQASISGVVFVDVNEDGLFQANEQGIDGVEIQLLDPHGDPVLDEHGEAILALTSNGGFYLFDDLEPAEYVVREVQPTGVADGVELPGSLGGTISANDAMQLSLAREDAFDYAFAEIGGQIGSGESAGIGFWQNKHGSDLIAAGGSALANWLTNEFGNVFGDALRGASGQQVADFYRNELFKQKGKNPTGSAKVDAQFMATALAVYFTNRNLAGSVGADFGLSVSDTGLGVRIVNVGGSGAAFGVGDWTNLTVMQLLQATNALTDTQKQLDGLARVYDVDGDGVIDNDERDLRGKANAIFDSINDSSKSA